MTTSDVTKQPMCEGDETCFHGAARQHGADYELCHIGALVGTGRNLCFARFRDAHIGGLVWRRIGETEWRTGLVEAPLMVVHCVRVANTTVCGLPVGVVAITAEERFADERAKLHGLTRCPACIAAVERKAEPPKAPSVQERVDAVNRWMTVHYALSMDPPKAADPEPPTLPFCRFNGCLERAKDSHLCSVHHERWTAAEKHPGISAAPWIRDLSPHLHSHVIRQPVGPQPCDNDEDGTL